MNNSDKNYADYSIAGISQRLPLRKAIFDTFKKSLNQELPIKGGWGYSVEDAIVIDKNDEVVKNKTFFDGVGLEYIIVEKRIYLEQIVLRRKEDSLAGIRWNLERQSTLHIGDKTYDHLIFTGYSLPVSDFDRLRADFIENEGNPNFNKLKNILEFESKKIPFRCEFYFDITSFY